MPQTGKNGWLLSAFAEKKSEEDLAGHTVFNLRYDPETESIVLRRPVVHGKSIIDSQLDELEQEVIDDLPELLEDFLAENKVVINNFLGRDYRKKSEISEKSREWIMNKFKEYLKKCNLPVPADLEEHFSFD